MSGDALGFDPFPDDELLSESREDDDEPEPWLKQMILQAARRSIAREAAERERLAKLGPRAKKKHMRKVFFDCLRDGATRAAAMQAAGITNAQLADWMRRQSFCASIERAELSAAREPDDFRL